MDASASIHIDRTPSDVFAYVLEVGNDAHWRTGVVEAAFTSEPPIGVGAEGFDRAEVNGRSATSRWRVIDFEPGAHVRWELVSGPIAGTGGYVSAPAEGGGTRFTLESFVQPTGLYRLLGPIFGVIGRRQNRADVAKLKAILEA